MFTKKYLTLGAFLLSLTPSIFGLTLEQSKQFRETDYILKDGITIEYKGEERELFFVDNGQPYHYSRIEQEEDGDLFRWVGGLRETKQEKYVKYMATPNDPIPEIIVREGFLTPFSGKTAPDTICDLVYDQQTGKPKNVYLVDFETQTFAPVLEQAVRDLREELELPITKEQAVFFFYDRCSSERFPFEQLKQEVRTSNTGTRKQIPEERGHQQQLADFREPDESTINGNIQSSNSSTQKGAEYCVEINNNVYKIADDERRTGRLAGFVSQLELVHSWDWGADSFSKLLSLINIAYPIFVHYEELTDELRKKYVWIIDEAYDISDDLYKQLPCQKRNAMNTVFEKVLGKIK
jgi:succinate dehydrogenase flavin-adding protein (antitoxin of CptAB toxin-antitoxin module)